MLNSPLRKKKMETPLPIPLPPFLTLSSMLTGFKIQGVKRMLGGGRVKKEKEEAVKHLSTMKKIAQAMYDKNHWNYLAPYSILKQMHKDLKKIIKKF